MAFTASLNPLAIRCPELRVYNTLTKTKEIFQPIEPPKVGIYLCGPTVYAESHIGHMVGPVIFDTVQAATCDIVATM